MPSLDRPSREQVPGLDIRKEWEKNVRSLAECGILHIDASTHERGVVGIDGTHYPIPTPQEIEAALGNDPVYAEKMRQGFTKLIIVPFAAPLGFLSSALGKATARASEKSPLVSTNGDPLECNTDEPIYVWDEYNNADVVGKLIYNPKQFTPQNHGGTTKQALLKNPKEAWRVYFLEENADIPRQGQIKTINERPQIESNKTPTEYLALVQTPPYTHESGLTPEAEIIHALHHLKVHNRIINDYQGTGSLNYLIGAWFPSSGRVPCAYWDRDGQLWRFGRGDPTARYGYCGFRPGVRVVL